MLVISRSILYLITASVLSLLILWSGERFVGIDWDYHVDSLHYIFDGPKVYAQMDSAVKGYYEFLNLLGFNKNIVLFANAVIFVATNIIAASLFKNIGVNYLRNVWGLFFFFNPYRIHLALTPLKETLLIFFLVLAIRVPWGKLLLAVSSAFIRPASIVYYYWFIDSKRTRLGLIILLVGLLVVFNEAFFRVLHNSAETNLVTREWDRVPHFQELGVLGNFLRALFWPLFLLSGLYFLMSPSAIYFALCFTTVPTGLFLLTRVRMSQFLDFYAALGGIALVVPGFTSYQRYVFPLIACGVLIQFRRLSSAPRVIK